MLIQAVEIEGASVYGVKQMSYTVEGESGKDYAAALIAASFKESNAIEEAASSFMAMVRQRQRKVEACGSILAAISAAIAQMDAGQKNKTSSDKPSPLTDGISSALKMARDLMAEFNVGDPNKITQQKENNNVVKWTTTRGNAMKLQNDMQYALDIEDNNLQQDMVSLQSLLAKRDNAFSTAAKVVRKANDAASNTISNI